MTATDSQLLPVVNGQVTLSTGDFGAPFDDTLQRVTGGAPIIVTGASRSVDGGLVMVTGTTSLLNTVQIAATLVAQQGSGGPTLTARFGLPMSAPHVWAFSSSFTNLPPFGGGTTKVPLPPAQPTGLLDRLTLSQPAFFINTLPGATDSMSGATLPLGLSFASDFAPCGVLGLIAGVISGGTSHLALVGPVYLPLPNEQTPSLGSVPLPQLPWRTTWPVPGVNLKAELGTMTLGTALTVSGIAFEIYSPSDAAWMAANTTYGPIAGASAQLAIPSAEITADVDVLSVLAPGQMNITGAFTGLTFQKLEDLVDAVGGSDLASFLPSDVQQGLSKVLGKLSLEAVALDVGTRFSIEAISVEIGIPNLDTTVLPGFTIDSLIANFTVTTPFVSTTRAVDVSIGGAVEMFGAQFDIELDLTTGSAIAELSAPIQVSLSAVAAKAGLSLPADIPDLTVDSMVFSADTNGALGFEITMAEGTNPWTIPLGPTALTVSDVQASIIKPASGTTSATFGGNLTIGGATFGFSYATPGDFLLTANILDVSLIKLAQDLTGSTFDFVPSGFDFTLDLASVLIQKQRSDLRFSLVTLISDTGMVGFDVQRQNRQWGFAFGLDLIEPSLSSLPGLESLKTFESTFSLDDLQLILSSVDNSDFQFLSASDFAGIALPPGSGVQLPSGSGGVIKGLNVHGSWSINLNASDQKLLQDLLGLQTTLDIMCQIGANPSQNSRLAVQIDTTLCGMPITGAFGGQIVNNDVSLFINGTLTSNIGGQQQTWTVTLQVFPNGVMFNGGMIGTVTFDGIQLSNMALAIGCDWEGIPSVGFAGTLTAGGFNSSLAVFFNSEDPSQSLLAGSISDLTLADVVDTFTGSQSPPDLDAVLKEIALLGTTPFTIPATTATALDTRDLATVSDAFATAGVELPTTSKQVLITVGTKDKNENGTKWFVTNIADGMKHYTAKLDGNQITVMLDAQLYVAPAAASLGGVPYNAGFFINGTLKILSFEVSVTINVDKVQGVAVDGSMSLIVIGTPKLFSLGSVEGTGGPSISLATFTQPQLPPPYQAPHAIVDASLEMLGLSRELLVTVETDKFSFLMDGSFEGIARYNLNGHFTSVSDLSIGGSVDLGFSTIDLGLFGTVNLGADIVLTPDIGVSGGSLWANFSYNLNLLSHRFSGLISLDVTTGELKSLANLARDKIKNLLLDFFSDPKTWALAVWQDIIMGIADLKQALMTEFRLTEGEADAIIDTLSATGGCAMVAAMGAVGASMPQLVRTNEGLLKKRRPNLG